MKAEMKNAMINRAQRSPNVEALKDRVSCDPKASLGDGLLSAEDLLKVVFPKSSSRPTTRWMRKLADTGELPHVRLGGKVFFPVERVRALLTGTAPRIKPALSEMSLAELWAEYSRVLDTSGRNAAHAFYINHLTQK